MISPPKVLFLSLAQPIRTWDRSLCERGVGLSRMAYPVKTAEFLEAIDYEGNLITSSPMGSYLIWAGWPRWMTSGDTRMEIGGEADLARRVAVETDMAVFNRMVDEYDVDAVALHHLLATRRKFAYNVAKDPRWALVYLDQATVVLLRRDSKWRQVIEQREIGLDEVLKKLQERQRRREAAGG